MKDTLIISNGSSQLLSQISILMEKKLEGRLLGIVRMVSKLELLDINKKSLDAEKWIVKVLKYNSLGVINRPFQIWGMSKIEKLFGLLFFKLKFRFYIKKHTVGINCQNVKNIIISYRPENGDAMLFSIFPNLENIYFNAEGNINYFKEKKIYRLPRVLKIWGISNIYNDNPDIYFPIHLIPKTVFNATVKTINQKIYQNVLLSISESTKIKELVSRIVLSDSEKSSILFMQPISFDWKVKNIVAFYLKVLHNEFNECNNPIVVKFHPRESEKNILAFKTIIDKELQTKVVYFNNDLLAYLPIEVLINKLKVNRAITISSTSVYYYKFINNVSIRIYSSTEFAEQMQNNIENLGKFLDVDVNYISDGNN